MLSEGLRPSDSPTRALARRCAGALRSRGSLAMLARTLERASGLRNGFLPPRAAEKCQAGLDEAWRRVPENWSMTAVGHNP